MPTFDYQCQKCGQVFEVRQSISDAPVTKCEVCSGKVKKLFSPPAIIFKGSGFHCNDYKSSGSPRRTSCPADKSGDTPCEKAGECKGDCAAT